MVWPINFIDCVINPVITLTIIPTCYSCGNHGGFSHAIKYGATDLFEQFEELIFVSKTWPAHEIRDISSEHAHAHLPNTTRVGDFWGRFSNWNRTKHQNIRSQQGYGLLTYFLPRRPCLRSKQVSPQGGKRFVLVLEFFSLLVFFMSLLLFFVFFALDLSSPFLAFLSSSSTSSSSSSSSSY